MTTALETCFIASMNMKQLVDTQLPICVNISTILLENAMQYCNMSMKDISFTTRTSLPLIHNYNQMSRKTMT